MLRKFQDAAKKVGIQAAAFGEKAAQTIDEGSKTIAGEFDLENECKRAAKTLESFLADPEDPQSALNSIPKAVLQRAKGLAIFRVVKASFGWSGKGGSGVVVARLPDGSWSAPSCIGTAGVGFGLQIGFDISEFVVVLNSEDAVKGFMKNGNVTFGGSLSASAGPIGTGTAIQSALMNPAPVFSYSKSKGLYAGISLEGAALVERSDANKKFYGANIPAMDLLSGQVPAPEAASRMYDVIEAAEGIDESGVPHKAYVPTAPGQKTKPLHTDDADDDVDLSPTVQGYNTTSTNAPGAPTTSTNNTNNSPTKYNSSSGGLLFDASEKGN